MTARSVAADETISSPAWLRGSRRGWSVACPRHSVRISVISWGRILSVTEKSNRISLRFDPLQSR